MFSKAHPQKRTIIKRRAIDRFTLGFPRDARLQSGIGDTWFTSLMKWIEAIDSGLLETLLPN